MKRSLQAIPLHKRYVSSRSSLIEEFYKPCLGVAATYDRAVGFFRSTLYVVTGIAFSDFAQRGGIARLVCSPELSSDDIQAIERGESLRDRLDARLQSELEQVLAQPRNRPLAEFLATLIALSVLDVRIAYRPGYSGIFHDKVGIFTGEGGEQVSFLGSANETYSAWNTIVNHEGLEVFCSWNSPGDSERVADHAAYFESLWAGDEPGVVVEPLPDVPRQYLKPLVNPDGIDPAAAAVRHAVVGGAPRDGHPDRKPLQEHQVESVRAWFQRGHRGIVTYVTGGGKTLTALEIIRRWVMERGPALILVPSDILLDQWLSEIRQDLADLDPFVLVVGGSQASRRWEEELADFTRDIPALGKRLVIGTIQTARTQRFRSRVQAGSHLLVVADEVHRLGSPKNRELLTVNAGGRLGLSATPKRFGDPEGTAAILDYFGDRLPPRFDIPDAIRAGRLVPYEYAVHWVPLTQSEQDQWNDLTEQIRKSYAKLPEGPDGLKQRSDYFRMLLIRRARILKKAERKPALAAEILADCYKEGQQWLVYCDDTHQLKAVSALLQRDTYSVLEYYSEMPGVRSETLEYFGRNGGILVAIRCLDEGVDIPSTTHALILASSSNPREFIQRRGRVLRTASDKHRAFIHDALVVPAHDGDTNDPDPLPILRTELARAARFAASADNVSVRNELRLKARRLGVEHMYDDLADFEEENHDRS